MDAKVKTLRQAQGKQKKVNAKAERDRRLELEALNGALAKKRCPNCATVGAWEIYDRDRTTGRTRYVKCLACGHCDQVPVIVKESSPQRTRRTQRTKVKGEN